MGEAIVIKTMMSLHSNNWGDKTRVTLLGDYAHTHGYDVVAYGNTGTQAQPDNDGFLSKTLYGALEHNFTDALERLCARLWL